MHAVEIHRLPTDRQTRRTLCAYVRADYPLEEIADGTDASVARRATVSRKRRRVLQPGRAAVANASAELKVDHGAHVARHR
jgi:hypothetical protein